MIDINERGNNQVKINEKIKQLRQIAQMTQQELADRIPCDVKTFSKYETGKLGISPETLDRIGQILSFDVELVKNRYSANELFFSVEGLTKIQKKLQCSTDKVLLQLLFEGVKMEELKSLRKEDVDYNTLTLWLSTQRTLKVSEYCIELINEALTEKKLVYSYGQKTIEKELKNSSYIIKEESNKDRNKIDMFIYSRLHHISEQINRKLSINAIRHSGGIYQGKQCLSRTGKIGDSDITEIAEKFDVPSSVFRDSVTVKNIYELYPEMKENKKR
jgi:transcriptional regulator with XRE-family HTH domain